MSDFTPLRSVLYMPSSNERALEKAKTIACDGLILDLEDAVAPDAKPAAREAAAAAAASGDYGRRTVAIRVNGLGTQWHDDDIVAASQAGPAAIVVPKVDSADDVARLVTAMEKAGAPDHTRLWAMVETPVAILDALAIARASERIGAFVLGTNDLVKELYAEHVPGRAPILPSLHTALLAGRAAGIAVIDGVYNDVKDTEGFLAECEQGRQMGFDGKTLIHPGQVEGANAAFAPSEQAVEDARGLIAAWEDGKGRGRGDLQRQDGGEPPRRVRASHAGDRRGDQGARHRLSALLWGWTEHGQAFTRREDPTLRTASGTARVIRPAHRWVGRIPPHHLGGTPMIVLGLILLILGLLLPQSILTTLGIILIVVGLVLNFVPIGGSSRRVW